MKKIIALLIALIALTLVLSLAACGGSESDVRGETNPAQTEAPTETEAPAEADFSLGSSSENTYRNEFIGIGCTLDANWTFNTDEEIREMNQITGELAGDELKEQLEKAELIYDMAASNSVNGCNVNVVMNNIGLLYGTLIDMDQFIDSGIEQVSTALESIGLTDVKATKTTYQFCGEEYDGIEIVGTLNGAEFYESQIEMKRGGYIVSITFAGYDKAGIESAMAAFYAL